MKAVSFIVVVGGFLIAAVVIVAAVGQGGDGEAEEEAKEEKSARQRRHWRLEGREKKQTWKCSSGCWAGGMFYKGKGTAIVVLHTLRGR